MTKAIISGRKTSASAIIGTTCPAAIGASRACWERGIEVGKDLSICAINIEPPAEFFCPSITGLNTPDLSDVLGRCFDWFLDRDSYRGPLLMEPKESSLFEGESTGRAKRARRKSLQKAR
ncbi:MAG: substrate-binding domain-containing protein [Pirellulales bacterium]